MMNDVVLSIAVITMNRAEQLTEALESCLACCLPEKTEFVVIDNASTDDTEGAVRACLGKSGYKYFYEKLNRNLGVGRGRNYAYTKSSGEYVYVLDDDAVIDYENRPDFFLRAIDAMNEHNNIVTLTTQIYDIAWKKNRVSVGGREIAPGLFMHQMFCGGSHFLRKSFFEQPPYLANKYGYEEIPPSLYAIDAGMVNAFYPELLVIHKPRIDKWDWSKQENHDLLVKGLAGHYAIKKGIFPAAAHPLLWAAAQVRILKSLRGIPGSRQRFYREVRAMSAEYKIPKRIRLSTVCRLAKEFGLSAF